MGCLHLQSHFSIFVVMASYVRKSVTCVVIVLCGLATRFFVKALKFNFLHRFCGEWHSVH